MIFSIFVGSFRTTRLGQKASSSVGTDIMSPCYTPKHGYMVNVLLGIRKELVAGELSVVEVTSYIYSLTSYIRGKTDLQVLSKTPW